MTLSLRPDEEPQNFFHVSSRKTKKKVHKHSEGSPFEYVQATRQARAAAVAVRELFSLPETSFSPSRESF